MSVTSGFFNSLNGDRKYDSLQVSELFDGLITDGVIQTIGNHFTVSATGQANQVTVGTGRAWFNHHWLKNDNILVVNLEPSDIMFKRYDAVVIEVNEDLSVRSCSIKVVKGVPASSPVYPTLTNTNIVHQYPLCYILRKVDDNVVTASDITQMVGKDACPYVVGIQKSISIEYLIDQWAKEWDDWFDIHSKELEHQTNLAVSLSRDAIDGTTAGNLQNQIDGKVSKSGDTMTGILGIDGDNKRTKVLPGVFWAKSVSDYGGTRGSFSIVAPGADSIGQRAEVSIVDNDTNDTLNRFCLLPDRTTFSKPVSIDGGGTGANSLPDARLNLLYALNPITNTDSDTTFNWSKLGSFIAVYSGLGQLKDKPSQFGFLLNQANGGAEVHQIWSTQPDGDMYHRGGNGSGWGANSWRKLLDSVNTLGYSVIDYKYVALYGGTLAAGGNKTVSATTSAFSTKPDKAVAATLVSYKASSYSITTTINSNNTVTLTATLYNATGTSGDTNLYMHVLGLKKIGG